MDARAQDERWLRRAIAVAVECVEAGDQAFGAVLVANDGSLLLEGRQTRATTGDCTAHAELNLVGEASQRWPREFLGACTLYSSTEPCLMCTGAIAWSGIGRVVFACSQRAMYAAFPDSVPRFPEPFSCAELLARVHPPVTVLGPLLEGEALAPHRLWAARHPEA